MIHYYYLHTNGDLIHKNAIVVDADPNYFDSDFVKKVWKLDDTDRGTAWVLCIEALALGARRERILELKEKWKLTDENADIFVKKAGLKLFKDGEHFCAAFGDFVDVHESQCGFGATALEALAELAKGGLLE
ncbi:MAG: hypothetical protein ABH950_01205 [Candidatus Altiarchaeota archaeon]